MEETKDKPGENKIKQPSKLPYLAAPSLPADSDSGKNRGKTRGKQRKNQGKQRENRKIETYGLFPHRLIIFFFPLCFIFISFSFLRDPWERRALDGD